MDAGTAPDDVGDAPNGGGGAPNGAQGTPNVKQTEPEPEPASVRDQRPSMAQRVRLQERLRLGLVTGGPRQARALENFERFHGMPEGTATLDQVQNSSAGLGGWAAASVQQPAASK